MSAEHLLTRRESTNPSYKVCLRHLFPYTCCPHSFLLLQSSCVLPPDTCQRQETSLQKSCKAGYCAPSQAPCSAYKVSFSRTLSRYSYFLNPMMLCYHLAPHTMFSPKLEAQTLPERHAEPGPHLDLQSSPAWEVCLKGYCSCVLTLLP